jgi:hypothetical protein
MALNECDPSIRRHQFRDADDVINSCAERRAAARTEPKTRDGRRGAWGRLD